jgi:hypothetical protein
LVEKKSFNEILFFPNCVRISTAGVEITPLGMDLEPYPSENTKFGPSCLSIRAVPNLVAESLKIPN